MSEGEGERPLGRAELLGTTHLFEGLGGDDLAALANAVTTRTCRAGETVFHQGDLGSEMYVIESGHVNIHLPGEASRRVSLKDVARGEYFGELSLFDDKPRSASALATTDASLLVVSRAMLADYMEKRPRAAMAILRTMSERLRETNAMLSERATKNVLEEMDKHLSWQDRLADRVAELNGSWAFILALLGLTCAWTVVNAPTFGHSFDPYPFVFFNLLLAILVALQGPLIVMSQNRQTMKDRKQADTDYKVNLKNEVNIESILRELGELRSEMNDRLEALEQGRAPRADHMPPQSRRSHSRFSS